MNGTVAQIVALALRGNAFLSGDATAGDGFTENSTARYCEWIRFVDARTNAAAQTEDVAIASDVAAWFSFLRGCDARRFSIRWRAGNVIGTPDRLLAGFAGGGGTWALVVRLGDGRHQQWQSRWEVGNRAAKDRKIWRVTYGLVAMTENAPSPALSIGEATARLKTALSEIHAFSARMKCDPFTQNFERALDALVREDGVGAFHRDLFPGPIPRDVARVLDACRHASVFGGMGSWNDMGFDGADESDYERVSENLFSAINSAIPAAVDSA